MPATKTRPPITNRTATSLRTMTSRIAAAEQLVDRRAAVMADLYAQGYSMDDIADAAGLNRSAIQKSLRRYEKRRGLDLVRAR